MLESAIQLAPRTRGSSRSSPSCSRRQGLRLRAQKALEAALRLAPRDAPPRRASAELGPGERERDEDLVRGASATWARKRKGNEDALFLNPEQKLYVVADGMGGHAAGEVASKVAVDAINEFVALTGGNEEITWPFGLDETISYDGNRLKTAIRHANRRVLEATRERPSTRAWRPRWPPSSWTATWPTSRHVGDSRIYLWSGGEITQLTQRPLLGQRADPERGHLAEQARSHPLRNVVTRALGGSATWSSTSSPRRMEPGDVLLLCSDGLTTMMPDEDIARDHRGEPKGDVAKAATALVDEANERGGEDNITVVLLKFEE